MSLQGLISGSECAVPFNPLSQVLKHTEGDRSVQQDRVAGPSSSRLHHLPSTSPAPAAEQDLAFARQFFDSDGARASSVPPMAMSPLPQPELANAMQIPRGAPHDLNGAWNDPRDMHAQFSSHDVKSQLGWAAEFGTQPQATGGASTAQTSTFQRQNFFQTPYMSSGMYGAAPMGMYSGVAFNTAPTESMDKGKGKAREIDFEAAFAQVAESLASHPQESARIEELDDTADLAAAMSGTKLDTPEVEAQNTSSKEEHGNLSFTSVWDQLQDSAIPPSKEDMARWEAEYNQLMSSTRDDDLDYGEVMQNAWSDATTHDITMKFDDEGMPILGEYTFEPENKYMNPSVSSSSFLRDAKALLDQGGSLTEAALMLEAAIQKGDLGEGGYEAWLLLGDVRSMDEREEQGMRALTEGVRRAQEAGAAGEGMLSLAISFTNESYERAAHTMLLRWLHARHPTHPIPESTWASLAGSAWHSHECVTQAFITLAQEQYAQGHIDPDVQIGLGVLFYSNGQYDRAKDCFETALSVRPEDYLLWNRLGSCLSNGNKPEEALGAYRRALNLRPTYTRAIYNVGVACLNIGAHKEAAEHFLSALSMQDSSGATKSDQVWFTLRRTFLQMDRADLAERAKAGTDVEVFRKEGFDF